jgi:hypothetical protein
MVRLTAPSRKKIKFSFTALVPKTDVHPVEKMAIGGHFGALVLRLSPEEDGQHPL